VDLLQFIRVVVDEFLCEFWFVAFGEVDGWECEEYVYELVQCLVHCVVGVCE